MNKKKCQHSSIMDVCHYRKGERLKWCKSCGTLMIVRMTDKPYTIMYYYPYSEIDKVLKIKEL
jgi:hypothetical protein